MKKKRGLGLFELTDCGGCALNVIFLYERLLELLKFYEIREFKMASSKGVEGAIDVALVSGTVSCERDLRVLNEARRRSKYLVALGTCAVHGCVQGSVEGDLQENLREVYGRDMKEMKPLKSKPIDEYVRVDFSVPGCPYDKDEVFQLLLCLAMGVEPERKSYPVCIECKLNEYECVLIKRRVPCLGPITAGGCDAICLKSGLGCIGCRGPLPEGGHPSLELTLLRELGYDEDYLRRKFRTFSRLEVGRP